MKVNYKPGTLFPNTFDYKEGDYVTVILRFWDVKNEEDTLYYHGTVTKIEEENGGFWAVLDDDKEVEEFFYFLDLEGVIDGERIPFLAGTTKRSKSDLEKRGI
jgi:hypothetical protein